MIEYVFIYVSVDAIWVSIERGLKIHCDVLQSPQNFLRDMQYMLHIAQNNIKTDRACSYANQH